MSALYFRRNQRFSDAVVIQCHVVFASSKHSMIGNAVVYTGRKTPPCLSYPRILAH